MVGDQSPPGLTKLDGELDGSFLTAAHEFSEAAAPCHGGGNVFGQGVSEKGKYVEEGGLSRSVGADNGQSFAAACLGIWEAPVVLDFNVFTASVSLCQP